ncbi:MAG: hypothetical protein KC656_34840, partial [Myxococcales bacterium]|nr:hypothetical protein [Myxococcales bacterium]
MDSVTWAWGIGGGLAVLVVGMGAAILKVGLDGVASEPKGWDPVAKGLHPKVTSPDAWTHLRPVLHAQPDDALRMFYLQEAAAWLEETSDEEAEALAAPVRGTADDPLGWVFLAAVALKRAVKARGHGTADTVTEDGGNLFTARAAQANAFLERARELDPEHPLALAL